MSFDTERFLDDHKLEYVLAHHHVSSGWAGIEECPFCLSGNYKFGIHLKTGACSCWMCGGHSIKKTVSLLLKLDSDQKAKAIVRKYSSADAVQKAPRRIETDLQPCKWPDGIEEKIPFRHMAYLDQRNFNHRLLIDKYKVRFTGAFSLDYKFRIVIPVFYKDVMVSYITRDVTGKSELKYRACEKQNETRFHRHCLYGLEHIKERKSCVVIEGATDVWRLGDGSLSTFGVKWSMPQAEQLLDFDRVFILYDSEEKAQESGERLGRMLACNGVDVEQLELQELEGKDPADLPQDDADHLMRELGIR